MLWNGMENGMKWKNVDMVNGRCSGWNGMADLENGMEDRLLYSYTNYMYISKLTTSYKVLPNWNKDKCKVRNSGC